jgi:hypothetical protein
MLWEPFHKKLDFYVYESVLVYRLVFCLLQTSSTTAEDSGKLLLAEKEKQEGSRKVRHHLPESRGC